MPRKTKIVRIIARLNIGGPAVHTVLLTQGLDKDKYDSLLVCGKINEDEGDMSYYACQKEVRPIVIPELKRELSFFSDLVALKKIYCLIKAENPDIIHTHTAKAGALGRTAGIIYNLFTWRRTRKKTKLIHTFHGHVLSGYFSRFKSRLFIIIEKFLALFTDKIITVSDSIKRELIRHSIAKENKIEIVPLGFDLTDLLHIPLKDRGILNVGIVGRLVPIKNHHLFLAMAARIIQDHPQKKIRFKIIGDGKLRETLERYSRNLKIDPWVDFLGWQRNPIDIYSNLDIVALTSLNEGTPVSLIEAMASARPVISTDVGGVKDLLGNELIPGGKINDGLQIAERGILVRSKDAAVFAEGLNLLLESNQLRKDIGLNSRAFVRKKFDKQRLIGDIERLYDGVLDK